MAEPVVSSIVKSLANIMSEEARLVEILGEIDGLQENLKLMLRFLRDADMRATEDDMVGKWVLDIKEVAYDAEDLIEIYVSQFRSMRRYGILGNLRRPVCICNDRYLLHKVSSKLHKLNKEISNLQTKLTNYGISTSSEGEATYLQQPSREKSDSADEDIIGLEDEVEQLVNLLLNRGAPRIVSICGMGGAGKTTLAMKAYQHPKVRIYFTRFAWICVSQEWEARDMLKSLMIQLAHEEREIVDEEPWRKEELIRQLDIIQKDQRCLIVLDDIWTEEALDLINSTFPSEYEGIKILLTTRRREIAPDVHEFELSILTEEESWELLKRKALRGVNFGGDEIHEKISFMELGIQMLRFCRGLPLAVTVLAGILSTKSSVSEWQAVCYSMRSYYSREDRFDRGSVYWLLALSYNDLPPPLKQCFVYLGSFSEDTNIKAESLYQLWIAEGFVSVNDRVREDESMMDLAEAYLSRLADRGLVQLQMFDVPKIRKIESCRLHDLIRDFCLFKAKEVKFFSIISSRFDEATRRLVINSSDEYIFHTLQRKDTAKKLRMLRVAFPDFHIVPVAEMFPSQFNNFKVLHVLAIEGLRPNHMWKLPKAIGKLNLLRYLSLKDSSIVALPSSLSNLKKLQTLDLRVFKLGRLPNILWKMAGLTYLYLPSLYKLDSHLFKLRLDGLSKLEILENFSDQVCRANDLIKLTNLQVLVGECLEIENLTTIANYARGNNSLKHVSISTDCDFRSNMDNGLQILKFSLFGSKVYSFRSQGALSKFPVAADHAQSYPSSSLVHLSMNLFGMKENDHVIETLEKLENLRTLRLWRFDGKEMTFHARGFPKLKTLKLFSFLNMKKWVVEEKALPCLSTLSIWGFTALDMIPDGLRFISTLKELDIRNMPEKFKAKIRQARKGGIGEDFENMSRVPLVLFDF